MLEEIKWPKKRHCNLENLNVSCATNQGGVPVRSEQIVKDDFVRGDTFRKGVTSCHHNVPRANRSGN